MFGSLGFEPIRSGAHGFGSRIVRFFSEVSTREVVAKPVWIRRIRVLGFGSKRWSTLPAKIRSRLPGVTLVAAHIVPSKEVCVVVLSTNFKQVRVVSD